MLTQEEALRIIPGEELLRRVEGLKRRMAAAGIDAALMVQNVDRLYFTGTVQKGMVVVPVDGEPLVFVEKSTERARAETPLPIVPVKNEKEIADIARERGLFKGTVGLELDVLPVTLFERLRQVMAIGRYKNIVPAIKAERAVKSPFELEQIRKSGAQMAPVFEKAKGLIREGITELEIDAELVAVGRKLGHQGFLRMRGLNQEMTTITVSSGVAAATHTCSDTPIGGFGVYPAMPQGSSLMRVARGIPVLLDYGGGYHGYVTDESRAYVVGDMDEAFQKPYEAAREIIADAISYGGAGVDTAELFLRARNIARKAGLDENFMGYGEGKVSFIAHGLGLEINELPVITEKHHGTLEAGMVFAFEPKFILPGKGAMGLEVDLIVRERGLERVTGDPIDLVYLK